MHTTMAEAIAAGDREFFPGTICRNGHRSIRVIDYQKGKGDGTWSGHFSKCRECKRESRRRHAYKDVWAVYRSTINSAINARLQGAPRRLTTGKADKYLGLPVEDYIIWIEDKFKPGMTWENWGLVWQIDHHRPCRDFNHRILNEILECLNYRNTYIADIRPTPPKPTRPSAAEQPTVEEIMQSGWKDDC